MHTHIRRWITEIVQNRREVLGIALCQRAKFEGWLKFELADKAYRAGAAVEFEPPLLADGRADLAIDLHGTRTFVELKTANFNWRVAGIQNKTRPVTMNIAGIVEDARKLRAVGGVLASLFFPIPKGDQRWQVYVERIEREAGLQLLQDELAQVIELPTCPANVLLISVSVPKAISA